MCDCDQKNFRAGRELRVFNSDGAFNHASTSGSSIFDTRPVLYGPDNKPIIKEKPEFGFRS